MARSSPFGKHVVLFPPRGQREAFVEAQVTDHADTRPWALRTAAKGAAMYRHQNGSWSNPGITRQREAVCMNNRLKRL